MPLGSGFVATAQVTPQVAAVAGTLIAAGAFPKHRRRTTRQVTVERPFVASRVGRQEALAIILASGIGAAVAPAALAHNVSDPGITLHA